MNLERNHRSRSDVQFFIDLNLAGIQPRQNSDEYNHSQTVFEDQWFQRHWPDWQSEDNGF